MFKYILRENISIILYGLYPWAKDTAERVVRTFVATFAITLLANDMSDVAAAVTASWTAAATVVLCILAKWRKDPRTASFVDSDLSS